MIELRWAVADQTTTEPPVLQYRVCDGGVLCGRWSEWMDVPKVVVPHTPKPSPSMANLKFVAEGAEGSAIAASMARRYGGTDFHGFSVTFPTFSKKE